MSIDEDSTQDEEGQPKRFTEAIKSKNYPEAGKIEGDDAMNFQSNLKPDAKEAVKLVKGRRNTVQKLVDSLSDIQADNMEAYGLAKEITLYGRKYTRNVINIGRRKTLAEISKTLESARFKPSFQEVELQCIIDKFKLIWNVEVTDEMDSELLYQIMQATDLAIDYKFR